MKCLTIIGARPQFIKAATVSRVFWNTPGVREILVHTGQHYDDNMSGVFFEELEIPKPNYNLNIGSGSHGAQTERMLEAIEKVLLSENPDWVIVYGDTNSTLAGAIASVKLHIPVAHIEAGLRSFNRKMPEDINVIDPVGYLDMVILEKNARLIVTDSGGVQKEAFFHSIPCVTLRAETEWSELVETGWNHLVPPNLDIKEIYLVMQSCSLQYKRKKTNLYGNGDSAEKIVEVLQSA